MRKGDNMKKLESLRENLCSELEKVAKKEDMTASDLELIDTLTHSIKNLDKVMLGNEMIEEYGYEFNGKHSRDGHDYSYGRRGRDGDNDGRYNESRASYNNSNRSYNNNSYDRSYDRSYENSNRYSGHYDEESIERFKHMMQDAIHQL